MDPRDRLVSWIEVQAEALAHNLRSFRGLLSPDCRLLLVVKSNAYGHGLPILTRLAAENDVDLLGVHSLQEAEAVRAAGWTRPLYILGYVARGSLERVVAAGAEPTVFDLTTIDILDRWGRESRRVVPCHLKLETGTHRQGIAEEEIPAYVERFRAAEGVRLEGLSMHFANIEDTTDHSYARGQLERFRRMLETFRRAGFDRCKIHCACTAAILTLPETQFDLVRLGIGAYGYWPSRETQVSSRIQAGEEFRLRPVLTWKTRIGQLKNVPAGAYVGYGCTERMRRPTRLAVLPVGYADGYDRGLSRLAHVLVRGRRAPVVGRICMNIILVDVTDIEGVAVEDEVVLLGRQEEEEITASHLADLVQTISYEILARISPALPRFAVAGDGGLLPGA
jgi:alanine racemase